MSNSIHFRLSRIVWIFLVSGFIPVALLLSLCGKDPAPGATNPPDTPDPKDTIKLSATPSVGSINLSWNYHDSLTYVLYWSENPGVSQSNAKIMNITSPYTLEGLKNDHTYYYRLGIIDGDKVISLSDEVKVTTRQINVVPNKPVLYASGGDQRVVLFWDNLEEPVNCTVYWSKNSGFNIGDCEQITVHQNPYIHTNLLNDITYYYRITVADANGRASDLSDQVEAYTHATTEIPTFPTNVSVQERNTMLTISWTPDGSATSYHIYWAKASGVDKNCSRETNLTNVFHFSNLENGTTYYIRISAENGKGEGQLSKEIKGTPKLLEPPQLKATPGYDDVTLEWPPVSNANSYNLKCQKSGSAHPDTFLNARSPFTHPNLVPGTNYTYSIVSINLDGESAPDVVTSSPLGLTIPSGLTSDTLKYREITIKWTPVKFADSYVVYWDDTTVTAATASAVDNGIKTTFTHTGLIPQKNYRYRVRAVKGSDTSALSAELKCTAKGLPAPKAMRLGAGYKKITINLDSAYAMPDKSPAAFILYWNDSSSTGTATPQNWIRSAGIRAVKGITLPYTMTGLEINRRYNFVLTVIDGEFEGDPTAILSTKTLDLTPPDSFKAVTGGYKEVTITWKNFDSADTYNLYWATADSVTKLSNKISLTSSPFIHTGLIAGAKYYYRISSIDGDYESALSATRSVAIAALTPPSTVTLKAGVDSISLSWSAVSIAKSYNIYWEMSEFVTKSSNKFSCSRTDTVHLNLSPETTYHYAVTSVNGPDESDLSKIYYIETGKLLPPTNISIAGGYRSIHLKWTKAVNAKSCRIYYSEGSNVDTSSSQKSVTGDSADLTDLSPGKTYYCKIASEIGVYKSALSSMVSKKTDSLAAPVVVDSKGAYRQISLFWKKVPFADSYLVALAETTHAIGPVDSISVTDTFFIRTNLKPAKNYWCSAVAAKGGDRSASSAMKTIKTEGLAAPSMSLSISGLAVRVVATSKYAEAIDILWSYSNDLSNADTLIKGVDVDYIDHPFDTLDAGKTRYYEAIAVRGEDKSEPSGIWSIVLTR